MKCKTVVESEQMQAIIDTAYDTHKNSKTLQEFWSRIGFVEKAAVFVGNLSTQVTNGGFAQWHKNGYSACSVELIEILQDADCREMATLVEKAARLLNAGLTDDAIFDMLEDRFIKLNCEMIDKVESYILENATYTQLPYFC